MSEFIIKVILICGLTMSAHANPRVNRMGALGTFEKLHLMSCVKRTCIDIQAAKAVQGSLTRSISFVNAKVDIKSNETRNSILQFEGSGYYDVIAEKIFFTDISDSKFKEAYFDKLTGKLFKL